MNLERAITTLIEIVGVEAVKQWRARLETEKYERTALVYFSTYINIPY